ncbi:MAG: UDP-3-O-(3-hydroxymyristoyl)glucosamine N-acyltransferase [Betaproteobacteria bacterium]|nr:UDP-3-O-(3-hydroxymyristoyl)glucosamine N-acyltransferase [Betaproteobacteria bacterium]
MARHVPPGSLTLAALAERCGAVLEGDGSVRISNVGTLEHAEPGAIAFLANPKYASLLAGTRASAVIVSAADALDTTLPKLVSPNPYLTYARVAALLHPEPAPASGVHPTAVVDPTATLGAGVAIGPHATVAAGATLADDVSIGPGCAIGPDVRIGTRSRLDARVVVYHRCVIGEDALVYAGAVIGADGFGLAADGDRWLRVPQIGRVLIGDRVEIGANTTIDRGAIDDTVIEDDVKMDNQVHIAHNCVIGAGTAIAGCVGIAGSARIGRKCRIGGAANVSGHLSIPDGTTLGGAASVLSSIDKPGAYSGAWPVQPYADWRRTAARLRRIDSLAARVAALERALRARDNEG